MGRPGQDTDFLLEHVPQFGQVGAGVGVRDECDGEAAGLQAVRNISRSTGRVVGIQAREQFKEMTGSSATWWRRASAASPTRSASSTRSSKTPLKCPRDGDWGCCYRFRARANRRWEGENPTCEVAVARDRGWPRPPSINK